MFFSSRMPLKRLASYCKRMSISLLAGIDVRTTCAREAKNASGLAARQHLTTISKMVDQGHTLGEGLAAAGDYFPPLMGELVHVGEQSGRLGEVLRQLADHYQNRIALRRSFLAVITWPAIELFAAIVIVGFLIWIMGVIGEPNQRSDPLGFGLVGNAGLAWYAAFIAIVGITLGLVIRAVMRGMLWTRPLQRFILRIPNIGTALHTLALSRLAWVMAQTMNTSMEVGLALRLSLQSTRNAWYIDRIGTIDAEIAAGNSIYDAFCAAGGFPAEFLESVHVGERTGNLVESMDHFGKIYQEEARSALQVLATAGGFAVWIGVATIIIFLIFRLASFYFGILNNAAGIR